MHARICSIALTLAALSTHAAAQEAETTVRAALAADGNSARLSVTSGGKTPGISVAVGKAKAMRLYGGEAVGTIETGHGKTVVAFAAASKGKAAFRIHVVDGETATLDRPSKRVDLPYAVVMTETPTGFTVLFQDIELANTNEAHTYLVELDKDGKPSTEAREVQIPWALADIAWNGDGYHLALYYSGNSDGVRLSMVSCTKAGTPQQHPDWASGAGLVSDVHLVTDGKKVRAFYRGGMGDRLLESDVTTIRQWGSEPPKAKDHGALGASQTIAITGKGVATKLAAK